MRVDDTAELDRAAQLPLFTPRRMVETAAVVLLLLVGIYFLFPKLVGLSDALSKLDDADPVWIVIAIGFCVASFATYIALFKAVVGGDVLRLTWVETYEINMAGVAATLLFSAGGAGGIVLTYWALRKAGMPRRDVGRRMVAFLSLHYAFYPFALIVFGVLLRTGVMNGKGSVELTIIPAAVAGLLLADRRAGRADPARPREARGAGRRGARRARPLRSPPRSPKCRRRWGRASASRSASSPTPRRGGLAVIGAAGFWATSIGVLWASFHAFGVHVPLAVVVQGFFLGMVANLFPLAPAGVGAVDAGMIGAFVLFGLPGAHRLPGDPRLPAGRFLAADPTRHRRLLPAPQHRPALGRRGPAGRPLAQA